MALPRLSWLRSKTRWRPHGRRRTLKTAEDEVNPGLELLAVVVLGQVRCGVMHEGVLRRVELGPLCSDGV